MATPSMLRRLLERLVLNFDSRRRRSLQRRRYPGLAQIEFLESRALLSATVLSVSLTDPVDAVTNADSVTYTVTFSEAVRGADPTD